MAIEGPKSPKPKSKKNPIKNQAKFKKKAVKNGGKRSGNPNFVPLGKNPLVEEKTKKEKKQKDKKSKKKKEEEEGDFFISAAPASQQLGFFLHQFQSANGFKLSPLELEAYRDTCIVELSHSINQDVENFSKHIKATFEATWEDVLCDGKLVEGKVNAGSPAVIVISASAVRSLELLRGLKPLTRECRPAKLFAKHLKVEEQVTLLKTRVNIACGTPSRIKKLIDIDALFLSRLEVIVLDMHRDAKGFSLFTLPQVRDEFWDLFKSHFSERLVQGNTRICFYGSIPSGEMTKVGHGDE